MEDGAENVSSISADNRTSYAQLSYTRTEKNKDQDLRGCDDDLNLGLDLLLLLIIASPHKIDNSFLFKMMSTAATFLRRAGASVKTSRVAPLAMGAVRIPHRRAL